MTTYREIVPFLQLAGFTVALHPRYLFFLLFEKSSYSLTSHSSLFLFLAGPTSFEPIIQMAMSVVEKSGGQFHVLLIITSGQVFYLNIVFFS